MNDYFCICEEPEEAFDFDHCHCARCGREIKPQVEDLTKIISKAAKASNKAQKALMDSVSHSASKQHNSNDTQTKSTYQKTKKVIHPSPKVEGWVKEFHKEFPKGVYYIASDEVIANITSNLKQFIASLLQEQRKASGGCTKCYGKGYATQIEGYSTNDGFTKWRENQINYCSCERGEQIKVLLSKRGNK